MSAADFARMTDADFLAEILLQLNAAPLHGDPTKLPITTTVADIRRLTHLAEEALCARSKQGAPVQIGPRGRLIALRDRDGQARLTALIEFDDEDALRAAGPLIACEVTLEPAIDLPKAANQTHQGEGSPSSQEDDD